MGKQVKRICPRCQYKNAILEVEVEKIPLRNFVAWLCKYFKFINNFILEHYSQFFCPICGQNNLTPAFGAYCLKNKPDAVNKGGVMGVLKEPLTEELKQTFATAFLNPDLDQDASYVTTYDDTNGLDVILGKLPEA
jgi:hypothetical protein